MIRIRKNDRVLVLTGAGISAESGIRTFRDTGGLWEQYPIDRVATLEGFDADPAFVWRFYHQRRADLAGVRPNPAHGALAALENFLGDNFLLVTQNVDDLHERAGSSRLIHMHGELLKTRCTVCGHVFLSPDPLPEMPNSACCGALLRPHIVWFGEMPFEMERIDRALGECTLFLSVGTSGSVYPAAGFIERARSAGAKTVALNPDPAARSRYADVFIAERAGTALPALVREWCSE